MAPKRPLGPDDASPPARRARAAGAHGYQWLSQHEAVLHRPDAYVGSNDPVAAEGYLLDAELKRHKREWTLSPIFMKIFDEVLVNALDASTRDGEVRKIAVTFDRASGAIAAQNDGRGIPIKLFVRDGVATDRYIPDVVFSELSAGSNFDDDQTRLVGGRNGVGVSCCNIWSTVFEVEVEDGTRSFQQTFKANLTERGTPVIKPKPTRGGRVHVRYVPDYARMAIDLPTHAERLEELLRTRAAEAAVCARLGVAVSFNGAKLPCKAAHFAAELFGTEAGLLTESFGRSDGGSGLELTLGARRQSEAFCGFVNGVRCDGGTLHATVFEKLLKAVGDIAKKQKLDVHVRPQTLKDHLAVLAIARIDKPRFTSQSKEALSTPSKAFGFAVELGDRFLAKLARLPVVEALLKAEVERELASNLKKVAPSKRGADVLIDKYDPALDCRKTPLECSLILTEGDSAKALATAGLAVVGREKFGVFPLRGVSLNVRNCPLAKAVLNKEIAALLKILNVSPNGAVDGLRYGSISVMSDQDADGSHICGLLLNVIDVFYPHVLAARPDFIRRIVTPLLKATPKGHGEVQAFFSMQAYEAWAAAVDLDRYTIKYYKGLGSSTTREAKEIFRDLARHTMVFSWDEHASTGLKAFFDDKLADERKRILTDDYDAQASVDYSVGELTVTDFLRRDMIHFSTYSNFRGLPSAIDGLTPARRKVLFYFLNHVKGEIKVSQAAAGVAQKTMYLHGETSIIESIVGLAQETVGTSNAALLLPIGQFGSRLDKPSVHAAPRYIFTALSNIARALFPADDDAVLAHRTEEGCRIEPVHYVPVIPTILINGATGIGTGFSTNVPCHSLPSVVACCRAALAGHPIPAPEPHYEGFVGRLEVTPKSVLTHGVFQRLSATSILVTELPIGRWTDHFLRDLKEGDKQKFPVTGVVNQSTEARVHVEVQFADAIDAASDEDLMKALRLTTSEATSHMYLFDAQYKLRLFEDYSTIVEEHAQERLRTNALRKAAMLQELQQKRARADARARFIALVISGALKLTGAKRAALEAELHDVHRLPKLPNAAGEPGYDAVLSMNFASCTSEHIEKLQHELEALAAAIVDLEGKTPASMWEEDLARLLLAHEEYLRLRAERAACEDDVDADAKGGGPRRRARVVRMPAQSRAKSGAKAKAKPKPGA